MPWGMIASAAVPWVLNRVFGGGSRQSGPTMEQAIQQATELLDPVFDERMEQTLANLTQQQIGRGFFGQAPAGAQQLRVATDEERARAQAVGNLATQLQGQSAQQQATARHQALQGAQLGMEGINQAFHHFGVPQPLAEGFHNLFGGQTTNPGGAGFGFTPQSPSMINTGLSSLTQRLGGITTAPSSPSQTFFDPFGR